MKKVLSVLLVISMLFTFSVMLVSCGSISAKDLEKDPAAVLGAAFENTANEFFEGDANAEKVLNKALESGKFTVSFEAPELLPEELGAIEEVIYVSQKKQQSVAQLSVTYGGEKYGASIFGKENGIAVTSNALFGDDTALAVYKDSFVEKFADSPYIELLQMTKAEAEEFVTEVKAMMDEAKAGSKDAEEFTKKQSEITNKLFALLDQSVSTEDAENSDGKSSKHIVATYALNNENLKEMVKTLINEYFTLIEEEGVSEEMLDLGMTWAEAKAQLDAELDEAFAELDASAEINLSLKIYVDAKANTITKLVIDGKVTPKTMGISTQEMAVNATFVFNAEEISLSFSANMGIDAITAQMKITKEKKDGGVTYKANASFGMGAITVDLFNATYAVTKDGNFSFNANIYSEEGNTAFGFTGKSTVTSNKAEFILSSVTVGPETYNFKLAISAEAVDSIPSFPENATDIMTLDKAKIEELVTKIFESPLGQLLASLEGTDPEYAG